MRKRKAANYERDLQKKLWDYGFACFRIAGSGSSPLPATDLLAFKNKKVYAIEVKTTRNGIIYLDREQLRELEVIKEAGIEVYIAVKFIGSKKGWMLIELDKVLKDNKLTIERLEKEGIKLEDFVKNK